MASELIGVEPTAFHPFEHWVPPVSVSRHQCTVVAFATSIALHGLLLLLAARWLIQDATNDDRGSPPPPAPIHIALKAVSETPVHGFRDDLAKPQGGGSESSISTPAHADSAKTATAPQPPRSDDSDQLPLRAVPPANIPAPLTAEPKATQPLFIGPEAVADAAKAALATEQNSLGITTQGAVVLDSALREQLNNAVHRTGNVGSEGSPDPVFDGAGWTQRVQIGDKCFSVQSANPLDSTSREAWYPTPCRR